MNTLVWIKGKVSKFLSCRCPPRWRRSSSCSGWGRSTTECSSGWTRPPSTCSGSLVSGQTLSKQIKLMIVVIPSATIILIKILALDCHADLKRGADAFTKSWALTWSWRFLFGQSWYWSPRIQACSLKVRFPSLCGWLIPRPIAWWGGACVAGSSRKPATLRLTTCWIWMKIFWRLVSEMTAWSWWRKFSEWKGFIQKPGAGSALPQSLFPEVLHKSWDYFLFSFYHASTF